jgi:hypothetical protein
MPQNTVYLIFILASWLVGDRLFAPFIFLPRPDRGD